MASFDNLDLKTRLFLKAYPFRKIAPYQPNALNKPLESCRVALVTSAGLVRIDDKSFEDVTGGDCSYRVIPAHQKLKELKEVHRSQSFDHSGIENDRNVAFPLDRLKELSEAGIIKEVSPIHISFMGSITAPGKLKKIYAPEAVTLLKKNHVDLVLLFPV